MSWNIALYIYITASSVVTPSLCHNHHGYCYDDCYCWDNHFVDSYISDPQSLDIVATVELTGVAVAIAV